VVGNKLTILHHLIARIWSFAKCFFTRADLLYISLCAWKTSWHEGGTQQKMEVGTRQKGGVTLGKQTASRQRTGTCVQIDGARLTAVFLLNTIKLFYVGSDLLRCMPKIVQSNMTIILALHINTA
jgi:hypothetical protein